MKKTLLTIAITFVISLTALAFEPDLTKVPSNSKEPFKYLKKEKAQQRGGDKQNVVKLKIIPLMLRTVSLQYERAFADNMSGACDLDVLFYSTSWSDMDVNGTLTFSGFGISPEFRFYPGGEAPKGFFVGPYLTYLRMGFTAKGTDHSGASASADLSGITAMGGGALLGYQWLIADVFSIELHLGAGFMSMSTPSFWTEKISGQPDKQVATPSVSFAGFLPTGGIQLGMAF